MSYDHLVVDGQPVYRVGSGVTPPTLTHQVPPQFSKEARKAKHQGTCVLWLVVGTDGSVHNLKVTRSVGMGLDEEAMKAVRKWTFKPGQKDGQPVAVSINVEVEFKLR